jgi:hypothetical protein
LGERPRRNTTETFTISIHGTGSDGSKLAAHETEHLSTSASGATLSFDKMRCGSQASLLLEEAATRRPPQHWIASLL